jgi:hypothetical protein
MARGVFSIAPPALAPTIQPTSVPTLITLADWAPPPPPSEHSRDQSPRTQPHKKKSGNHVRDNTKSNSKRNDKARAKGMGKTARAGTSLCLFCRTLQETRRFSLIESYAPHTFYTLRVLFSNVFYFESSSCCLSSPTQS